EKSSPRLKKGIAMTIDATPGGAEADSYVTLTQADEYFQDDYDFSSNWSNLSEQDRSRLLITATRMLDRLNYKGRRYDYFTPQALKFPRVIGDEVISLDQAGQLTIPVFVRRAVCEQARQVYQSGSAGGAEDLAFMGVESFRLDKIALNLSGGQTTHGLCPAASRLLAPFLVHSVELRRA
ncbi:MAG: DnaT-like ssDNA-binding protein, partial [Thermodesulfobacteriota bacterium]|nr:DnaT-like ssDNA-binding protein [Thermodesulfobacteriota bacterium]